MKDRLLTWLKDSTSCLIILGLTSLQALFFGAAWFPPGWKSFSLTLIRFLRFSVLLCLPLSLLPPLYSLVLRKMRNSLLDMGWSAPFTIRPLKHYLVRPFQGIGIGMLFSTKLVAVLQLVGGPAVKPSLFLPGDHFRWQLFIATTAISVLVSLALSLLWTLDDTGIRYYNRKDQEIKTLGKYVGTIMPVVFGFYGVFSLLANYGAMEAPLYLFKITVVLYPPFAAFAIIHQRFVEIRADFFSEKHGITKGRIEVDR